LWAYTLSGTITCSTLSLEMACIDIIVGDVLPDADDTDETLRFFRNRNTSFLLRSSCTSHNV
jgi:hypothetical protein